MDRNRDLFVAAFPYADGRVLYVLKDTRRCPDCGAEVKLVIETPTEMPRCVPCAERRRPVQSALQGLSVRKCSACGNDHEVPRALLLHDAAGDYFLCPKVRARVDVT